MARPSKNQERREAYLPVLAEAFVELGYRRATTAVLASRLGIRENQLYRIWPDKKSMFIDMIDYVYQRSRKHWQQVIDNRPETQSPIEALRDYTAEHYSDDRMYRVVFAGLSETDDPDVRAALRRMYKRYHAFLVELIGSDKNDPVATMQAWLLVGAGVVCDLGIELNTLTKKERRSLVHAAAAMLGASR